MLKFVNFNDVGSTSSVNLLQMQDGVLNAPTTGQATKSKTPFTGLRTKPPIPFTKPNGNPLIPSFLTSK